MYQENSHNFAWMMNPKSVAKMHQIDENAPD